MTPARFIEKREGDWRELEELLGDVENRPDARIPAGSFLRFGKLYRAACTDLSLATALRLPRETQLYLEDLVSRSHSNLYSFQQRRWKHLKELFTVKIPRLVFADRYVRICLLAFYVPFFATAVLGYHSRDFVEAVIGQAEMQSYEEMHFDGENRENPGAGGIAAGTGFYIWNNVSIALMTFSAGILGGVLSLLVAFVNAAYLGTVIGFLLTTGAREGILGWIPGHAPWELTAIALAAGAGLRIGFSFIAPEGRRRMRALREEARASVPIITAAVLMLLLAAVLEATLAPSALPMFVKWAAGGAGLVFLIAYFGLYGGFVHRRESNREERLRRA